MKAIRGKFPVRFLAAILSLTAPCAASAQTREEIQRDRLEQQLRTEGQAVAVQGAPDGAACPLADAQFADLRFTFSEAQFTGLEAVDPGLITPAYAGLVGRDMPVSAICDIRDRAARLLREAGYLAAVQVPVQSIDAGRVRFDVIAARMTAVQVRGDAGASSRLLQKYIDKLVGQPVFNIHDAERYLLLARDIPGLDVRLVLQPAPAEAGGQPGEVVGIFNVSRTPFYVDGTIQNFGSKAVGRFGGLARVRLNGITGAGDQTTISAYAAETPDEQYVFQLGHQFRVGSDGLTIGADATLAWSRPDIAGPDLFESKTFIGSLYATYPFKRTQTANVFGTIGFDFVDQHIDVSGLPLSKDNLRVAFARFDFNSVDEASVRGVDGYSSIEPRFALAGSLELRQGFDLLGASNPCGAGFVNCTAPGVVPPSRLDADPTAFVIRGQAQVDFRPIPLLLLSLKPRFQFSPDALLSYEQVSGGNYTAGRGFDPGAIIGDSGYGGQFELAYGSLVPETPGGNAWQPYAFFDLMAVSRKNVPGDPQTITSAGAGFRSVLGRHTYFDIFGAVPLKRAPFQAKRSDLRLLMTLSVQFGGATQ